jgi:hypothetical protein
MVMLFSSYAYNSTVAFHFILLIFQKSKFFRGIIRKFLKMPAVHFEAYVIPHINHRQLLQYENDGVEP